MRSGNSSAREVARQECEDATKQSEQVIYRPFGGWWCRTLGVETCQVDRTSGKRDSFDFCARSYFRCRSINTRLRKFARPFSCVPSMIDSLEVEVLYPA